MLEFIVGIIVMIAPTGEVQTVVGGFDTYEECVAASEEATGYLKLNLPAEVDVRYACIPSGNIRH